MEDLKIKVDKKSDVELVVSMLVELGFELESSNVVCVGMVGTFENHIYSDYLSHFDGFDYTGKEITIDQLRDMVVLKRNDVKDATHTDQDGWKWFISSDDKGYVFQAGNSENLKQWDESSLDHVDLKPLKKEKIMKEWIYKDGSGEYVLTTDPEVANLAADAVEVPCGANVYARCNIFGDYKFLPKIIDGEWSVLWKRQPTSETEYLLQGKNGDYLLESIEQLKDDSNFEKLVQKGIDEANSGKLIPHNEVMEKINTKIEMCKGGSKSADNVNHPSHYCSHPSGIECIEITRHHDFAIGNAIKYLWRAGLKDSDNEVQDLEKAIFYIKDKIKQLKAKSVDDKTIDWIDESEK